MAGGEGSRTENVRGSVLGALDRGPKSWSQSFLLSLTISLCREHRVPAAPGRGGMGDHPHRHQNFVRRPRLLLGL